MAPNRIVRAPQLVVVLFVLVAAASATGCYTPVAPSVERMQAATSPRQAAAHASGSFAYSTLLIGEITGETDAGANIQSVRDALWHAMTTSLENSGIFRAVLTSGKADCRLDGVIVSHREITGALMVTSSVLLVRYKLTDLATNRVVWRESIMSHFDSPSGNDVTGANEGAVHDNLTRLLDRLSALSPAQARAG
jgi:hypothetical protein